MEPNPIPEPNDLPPMNGNLQTPPIFQTEATPSVVPVIPKAKSKLVPILLAILAILILGIGGYFVYAKFFAPKPVATVPSPAPMATSDPTVSWKTITNQTAGLSVKYPSNMTAEQSDNHISLDLQTIKPDASGKSSGSNLGYSPLHVQISRKPEWDGDNISTIAKDQLEQEKGVLSNITNIKALDETFSNAQMEYFAIGCNGYCTNIFLKQNNQVVLIEVVYGNGTELQTYEDLANQILSTFKFTDQTSSATISNEYSIQIPSSWDGKYKKESSQNCDIYNFIGKTTNYLLFGICRMSPGEWAKNQSLDSPERISSEGKLATTVKYVYFYNFSLDNPYSGEEGNSYQNLAAGISTIIKSFKLN